jgi:hypothetical protein
MRLNQLFEDVASDHQNLNMAEAAWDDLKEEIHWHIVLLGLEEFEAFEKSFSEILNTLSKYNFNVFYKDIPVIVNLVDKKFSRGALGRLRTTSIDHGNNHVDYRYNIELYYNPDSDLDLISIRDFYKTFEETFEKVFIHEFTHFLDDYRSHNKNNYIKTKSNLRSKGHYVDTPHEYNAFYMQMVKELKRAFKSREVVEMFKKNPDFKSFQSIVSMDTEAGRILLDLEGKYKRALQKRLFQLYKEYYRTYIET